MTDSKVVSAELIAAQAALRAYYDNNLFGKLITDEECLQIAAAVVDAVDKVRDATKGT